MDFSNLSCKICGGKSTGVHYGVVSCEGCKAFYKRGLGKHTKYKCYFGGTCSVLAKTRGRCKSCRFRKCVDMGMDLQAVKMGRIPKLDKEKLFEDTGSNGYSSSDRKDSEMGSSENSRHSMENTVVRFASPMDSSLPCSSGDYHGSIRSEKSNQVNSPSAGNSTNIAKVARASVIKMTKSTVATSESPSSNSDDMQGQKNIESKLMGLGRKTPALVSSSSTHLLHSQLAEALGIFNQISFPDLITSRPFVVKDVNMAVLPQFLDRYWKLINERNESMRHSIHAVRFAMNSAFGDEIEIWDTFMEDVLEHGPPFQPQTTVEGMMEYLKAQVSNSVQRHARFCSLIPGFSDLNFFDQKTLVAERWLEMNLIHLAKYLKNNEQYYAIGPDKDVHFGRYWIDQFIEPEFQRFCFGFADEFNAIGLSLTEIYILAVICIFRPDTSCASNTVLMSYVHAYFLDVLFYSVGSRLGLAERSETFLRIQKLMTRFPQMHRLSVSYMLQLDMNSTPWHNLSGVSIEVLMEEDSQGNSSI